MDSAHLLGFFVNEAAGMGLVTFESGFWRAQLDPRHANLDSADVRKGGIAGISHPIIVYKIRVSEDMSHRYDPPQSVCILLKQLGANRRGEPYLLEYKGEYLGPEMHGNESSQDTQQGISLRVARWKPCAPVKFSLANLNGRRRPSFSLTPVRFTGEKLPDRIIALAVSFPSTQT